MITSRSVISADSFRGELIDSRRDKDFGVQQERALINPYAPNVEKRPGKHQNDVQDKLSTIIERLMDAQSHLETRLVVDEKASSELHGLGSTLDRLEGVSIVLHQIVKSGMTASTVLQPTVKEPSALPPPLDTSSSSSHDTSVASVEAIQRILDDYDESDLSFSPFSADQYDSPSPSPLRQNRDRPSCLLQTENKELTRNSHYLPMSDSPPTSEESQDRKKCKSQEVSMHPRSIYRRGVTSRIRAPRPSTVHDRSGKIFADNLNISPLIAERFETEGKRNETVTGSIPLTETAGSSHGPRRNNREARIYELLSENESSNYDQTESGSSGGEKVGISSDDNRVQLVVGTVPHAFQLANNTCFQGF